MSPEEYDDFYEDDDGSPLLVHSCGMGVQSIAIALMAEKGLLGEKPDCAIFADTQAEPAHVYRWKEWLEQNVSWPIYTVTHGDMRAAILASSKPNFTGRFAGPPFYTTVANQDRAGMLRRQCTREYKIAPINKKIRELVGLKPRQRAPKGKVLARQWIGISWDEAQRMKDAPQHWLKNEFPLIELGKTRLHCLEWLQEQGLNELPSKSACTFCPYHDDATWLRMQETDPAAFEDACKVDEAIRIGVRGTTENLYVHRSLVPLREVDFSKPDDGQGRFTFMDECDGMCGL